MSRKGQGISINMVIIAAIAILVLVVAVVLVSKGGRNVDQATGTKSCIAQGGTCKSLCDRASEEAVDPSNPTLNCNAGQVCCRYNFGG